MDGLDEKGLYDIYSIWHVPFWQTTQFYIIVSVICLLVILALAWWLIRKYIKKNRKPVPAWQRALEQLQQLQNKTYSSKQEGKQCYFAITSILKQYLQNRYQFDAPSKTDTELIQYLQKNKYSETLAQNMKDICNGCILIKFANQQAMQEQIVQHIALGIQIVRQTMVPDKKKT